MSSVIAEQASAGNVARGGLPAWSYDNDEMMALENEMLFRRHWLLVGHVNQIPEPGDFMTLDVADERALVVRGRDGGVRAFHNLCRHRGSRVVAGAHGNCGAVITCPFHGWSYSLDGGLQGMPHPKSFGAMSKTGLGLKPLDREIWHGMVFIRFKGDGPSIAETLAPIEAEIAPYRLEEMRPIDGGPWHMEFEANWKATVDVDNEGYHVPVAHPGLNDLYGHSYIDEMLENRIPRSTGTFGDRRHKLWSVRHYAKLLPEQTHLPESQRKAWIYYGVFPGAVLTFYPDSCGFYQFLPLGTRRSAMRGCGFGRADESREMRAARYLNRRINNVTGAEDIQLIKWSWEGMRSSAFEGFILSDLESGVRAYHDRLREVLPVLNLPEAPPSGTLAERNRELGDAA
jgi:phenylpropionate dioxygenase-like ring-hydroxylating dioxygenase large terminal subunit